MLAFAARQGVASGTPGRRRGWTVTVGWFRAPGVYRAKVYRADVARTAEREHPTDPAAALARALLTVASSDDRGPRPRPARVGCAAVDTEGVPDSTAPASPTA